MNKLSIAVVGAALALSACSGISTSTDYDPAVNFGNYGTYTWLDTEGDHKEAILDSRVKSAVDAALTARGFTRDDSNPDLAVGYQVSTAERRSYNTMNTGWGGGYGYYGGWGMGMGMSTTTENVWEEGTLVVGMFDVESKNLVWHGQATGTVDPGRSPEERQQIITEAINKMMKDFPPGM